jgi:hypothetical protein
MSSVVWHHMYCICFSENINKNTSSVTYAI